MITITISLKQILYFLILWFGSGIVFSLPLLKLGSCILKKDIEFCPRTILLSILLGPIIGITIIYILIEKLIDHIWGPRQWVLIEKIGEPDFDYDKVCSYKPRLTDKYGDSYIYMSKDTRKERIFEEDDDSREYFKLTYRKQRNTDVVLNPRSKKIEEMLK